jgi:hypothetical protein
MIENLQVIPEKDNLSKHNRFEVSLWLFKPHAQYLNTMY